MAPRQLTTGPTSQDVSGSPGERSELLEAERAGRRARRRRSAVQRRVLASCDLLSVIGALGFAYVVRGSIHPSTFFWALVFSPVWVLVAKLDGLYDNDHRRIRHSTVDELPGLLSTSVLATLLIAGLVSLSPAPALSTADAILIASVALGLAALLRAATRQAFRRLVEPEAGVVIGSRESVAVLARRLAVHPEARIGVVGYLGEPPDSPADDGEELRWLGRFTDLGAVSARYGVERALIAEDSLNHQQVSDVITQAKRSGLALTIVPENSSLLGPGTELNRLGALALLDFRFSDPSRSTMLMKRGLDIVISATTLLLLSPLLLLIGVLIKLDSRGPVLFRQVRVGRGGRPFRMLKFRSMDWDAEQRLPELIDVKVLKQPAFKIPDDPRVTRVGARLRRFSLDELPQLLNVLRGDMSLVGPRPEEQAVVDLYDDQQRSRLDVKPGMTGPMQVYGRGDLTFEERFALERDYMDNLSIGGDLAILLRTPRAMFRGEGAY
jgi:exopolysaccharide biosynthesis polyprenyl glycosylphosphotransferase